MTIDLVVGHLRQAAATGAPTVTAASGTGYTEGIALTATTTGITDANGIDADTLTWQWQSAAAPMTGTPAAGDYADITDATEATFTPRQAQATRYVRVCASFDDAAGNSEGPLCSTGVQVTDVR